jgi:hypothetical protein
VEPPSDGGGGGGGGAELEARLEGALAQLAALQGQVNDVHFLCLITPLCSYLYGSLYGGSYARAHIIRYFPPRPLPRNR